MGSLQKWVADKAILEIISANPSLSARAFSERMSEKVSEKTQVVDRTVERDIAKLKKMEILTR